MPVKTPSEILEETLQKGRQKKLKFKVGDLVKVKLDLTGIFKNPPKYMQDAIIVGVDGEQIDVEYLRNEEKHVLRMKSEFLVKV